MIQMLATFVRGAIQRLHIDERGQDVLEWILLSGLLIIAIIAAAAILDPAIQDFFTDVAECIDFDSSGCDIVSL